MTLLHPLVPLYAAGPFLLNTSLFTVRQKADKNIYNEREKNEIVKKQFSVFFSFLFVCISFYEFLHLFICVFFVIFYLYLRELSPMMSNKQTNKKNQSYQLALHSLREVLGMEWRVIVPNSWMNTEGE